jgi:hypothetical protein
MKTIFKVFLLLFCATTYAQTTVTGIVTDDSGQPLPGANVIIVGTSTGTVTDFDGNFSLTTDQDAPFTIQISSIGFESSDQDVTANSQKFNVTLKEGSELDEVVISASRTPERIRESPVTVERMDTRAIRNASAPTFYDSLENLKGVDMNTNSLTFKSMNTSGFATFANNRCMQ